MMAFKVTQTRTSPLIFSNSVSKPCSPASFGIPQKSKFSKNLRQRNSRITKISSSQNKSFESKAGFVSESGKTISEVDQQKLKPLWDDGYGTQTVIDYLEASKNMIHSDGGPPRWFCPIESGPPLKDSPLLLFLPGIDGLGMGLILHHKALGNVFEVRCMHIPVYDRTPYEGLVKFVEETARSEHVSNPNRPIYIVGDSFGGCLALSVAASNPTIDLVLILTNPATSFNRSQMQALLPILEAFPEELHVVLPYLLGTTLGNPIKMANVTNTNNLCIPLTKQLHKLTQELLSILTKLPDLANILPKKTLTWKLKLLKSAAASSNSRLHNVEAQVLVLASGKDSILPSKHEARRLSNSLKNCRIRVFEGNGHTLLLEDGINLLTVIKGTCVYRRSKTRDYVSDFLPPSMSEFREARDRSLRYYHLATSPAMFSTLPDGKIVRGLKGVPDQGPVLLVGYHMLFGSEIGSLIEGFLEEKKIMVHGIAHPEMFTQKQTGPIPDGLSFDLLKLFGALPVTPTTLFKLLKTKSHVLLYPGGVREALHRKGEAYKLFWPEEPEFVRMATRFGAKIVPFGVVGEDDIIELVLDYNDMMKLPLIKDSIQHTNQKVVRVREGSEVKGEVSNQDFFVPLFYPKVPSGRFYFLFGEPMETKGKEKWIENRDNAKEFYEQIKSSVEKNLQYLIKKREEDPYRYLFDRLFYRAVSSPLYDDPSFDP